MSDRRPYTGPRCYVEILHGKDRGSVGYIRGTWAEREATFKSWGLLSASQCKVFVHGIGPHLRIVRFDKVRELTQLEIAALELNGGLPCGS